MEMNYRTISELKHLIEKGEKMKEKIDRNNEAIRKVVDILETYELPDNIYEVSSAEIIKTLEAQQIHPDYPMDDGLAKKLIYMCDKLNRFASTDEISEFITKIEGEGAKKTLNHLPQKLHYLVKQKELIKMKYNNSNKYTFYATRRDWLDIKGKVIQLIPRHAPNPELIKNLTDEQKAPENIVWDGLGKLH